MPVSVVVGGQYGSEGKGKVALEIARRAGPDVVTVRVGGSNSGHTAYDARGEQRVLRQLPAAAIDGSALIVLPAGSYIDLEVLHREIMLLGLRPGQLVIDPAARIITAAHRAWERESALADAIGSTASGTGAAVIAAAARNADRIGMDSPRAAGIDTLAPYLASAADHLRERVTAGARVVIEGTQGFGLSVLHGEWPHATSRDTTAAGFLAEAGLSPLDVDDVTLVLRCHPIRVAGRSGRLNGETDWETIGAEAGADRDLTENTTVTCRVRRVGRFDAELVRRAIGINRPTRIVLNHLDYVDWSVRSGELTSAAVSFLQDVERSIGATVDWVGVNERDFVDVARNIAGARRIRA